MATIAVLLGGGSALFVANFPIAPRVLMRARAVGVAAAIGGLALVPLLVAIRAGRIAGQAAGMTDPIFLSLVWSSPLGDAVTWRCVGLALAALSLWAAPRRNGVAMAVGILGAGLIACSFAMVGHTLGEPRWALALLVAVHVLAVSWWFAALPPLYVAARDPGGAPLLETFGRTALAVVAALLAAGVGLSWFLVGGLAPLFGTAYGWTLLLKAGLVAGLLALAVANKLRLVPRLKRGEAKATNALRTSITWEAAAFALIVLLTAIMTSATIPPVNM